MRRVLLASALGVAAVGASTSSPGRRRLEDALTVDAAPAKVPDAYIVTLCEEAASNEGEDEVVQYIHEADEDEALPSWHSKIKFEIRPTRLSNRHFMVTLTDTTPEAVADLLTLSSVCGVMEDAVIHAFADDDLVVPWGLDRIDQLDLPLDSSYATNNDLTGSGVDVYIMDSGLDTEHSEFSNDPTRKVLNVFDVYDTTGNCPGHVCNGGTAGVNGHGSHVVHNNDALGHGSHVAGTVGGATVGVAPRANLFGVRILDDTGAGTYSGALAAMSWVGDEAEMRGNPSIATMSLGGQLFPWYNGQVDELVGEGVFVVVAAGNDGADACDFSPSSAASVVTVGSTTAADGVSWFSNTGSCVDIYAPGSDIKSVAAGSSTGFTLKSGTSMACPHVAGIAALHYERKSSSTPAELKQLLSSTAAPDKIGQGLDLAQVPPYQIPGDPSSQPSQQPSTEPSRQPSAQPSKPTKISDGDDMNPGGDDGMMSPGGNDDYDDWWEWDDYYYDDNTDDDEEEAELPTPPTSKPTLKPTTATAGADVMGADGPQAEATGAICFTGNSLLTLEDGSTKKFRDLQVGDVIMSADRMGLISPSPVLFLPHKKNDMTRNFDEISTIFGKAVRMTRNHLLPLCDGSLVTARSIKQGDCLLTTDGEDRVKTTLKDVEAGGIYTAVTKNEYIVVDGIVASPFALAHGIAHSFFDRGDVAEWCKGNSHLLPAAADEEIKEHVESRRRRLLADGSADGKESGCVKLMEVLFENYKDEGVGWGTNGWGYKNFKTTLRGAAQNEKKNPSLQMRLSGFANNK